MDAALAERPKTKPRRTAGTITREEHSRRVDELRATIDASNVLYEQMMQTHATLARKVAALQSELGEKNRLLERRNRLAALGEMAAGMAHEIRNPLGAIKLYASLLRDDVAGAPAAVTTVAKLSSAATRVEGIVGQVLYFTRELAAAPAECCVASVVRESAELARAAGEGRREGGAVNVEVVAPARLAATVDARLVGQAVVNLVANAVEAAAARVEVSVAEIATADGRLRARVRVDDDGPGVAPDALDRVFHPFFTTKHTGTGLGLAIVHRIAEAHDGTVEAGARPGGGARFELIV